MNLKRCEACDVVIQYPAEYVHDPELCEDCDGDGQERGWEGGAILPWFAFILACALPSVALASPLPNADDERLAFDVARVAYNEHQNDADSLSLIGAVTRGHGPTSRARRAWLTCHSPRVLARRTGGVWAPASYCRTRKVCREGRNCRWTRSLRKDGAMPAGYPHSRGHWRRVHRRRWLRHLTAAREHVAGRGAPSPCPGEFVPYSWGGRMDVREHARRAGDGHIYVLMVLRRDGVVRLDNGTTIRRCSSRAAGRAQNYGFFRPSRQAVTRQGGASRLAVTAKPGEYRGFSLGTAPAILRDMTNTTTLNWEELDARTGLWEAEVNADTIYIVESCAPFEGWQAVLCCPSEATVTLIAYVDSPDAGRAAVEAARG